MEQIYIAIVAGGIGALITYFLTRGSEISEKIYERQKGNFNALFRLEYLCCQNMNCINDTIFVIDDFISTVEEPLKQNQPVVYGNKLSPIPFDESIMFDLSGPDLMNKLLEYKIDIIKTNNDVSTINEMYHTFTNSLISKDIEKINNQT